MEKFTFTGQAEEKTESLAIINATSRADAAVRESVATYVPGSTRIERTSPTGDGLWLAEVSMQGEMD